ncbi:MAG: glycoside hydrolase family 16 protein [Phototrophicaceae bacterium]
MTVSADDFPANPPEKAGYILEFQDEFSGDTLDTSRWLPYYLPQWCSRADSTPHFTLEDNTLILQITENQSAWCPEFDGDVKVSSIQTGVFGGALGSPYGQHRFNDGCRVREVQDNVQLYTPLYGYFEIRAKSVNTPRNLCALWMIGYEDQPEKSGEIAIFEVFGGYVTDSSARVGYGVHPWGDDSLTDEFYNDFLAIDATQFHIYAAEWTPTHIDFYVDNQKVRTIYQSPNYPMQFMLNIYELPDAIGTNLVESHQYPKNFVVDYVRGYRPIGGYGAS